MLVSETSAVAFPLTRFRGLARLPSSARVVIAYCTYENRYDFSSDLCVSVTSSAIKRRQQLHNVA